LEIIIGFKSRLLIILTVLACFVWSNFVAADELVVSHGYARATPPGVNSAAAYLTLGNSNKEKSVVLVSITSHHARRVMIHQNQLQGDMIHMRHVSQLEIEAGSQFRFEPGGHHLMLTELIQPLRAGDQLQLSLQFQQGGVLEISLPILAVGAKVKSHYE